MEQVVQDVRFALRTLLKYPAFTFAAVAALALGIGSTTAVFSVVSTVLLKPLPYPDADRIVMFENITPQRTFNGASPAKFAHWSQQTDIIQDAAAFRTALLNYTGSDAADQVSSGTVSRDFFRLFGARVELGRTFSEDEDRPNGPRVVVLSNGWWQSRFGSDPSILGKTVQLSGYPYVVIGVLASDFDPTDLLDRPSVYTALQLDPNSADQGHFFRAAARLRSGATLKQAKARLAQSTDEFQAKYPDALSANTTFSAEAIGNVFVRDSRTLLLVLLGAVSGVLLIACANVANLLLVRSTVRKREIAIRTAMGADRGRIVRQLMTESVALSAVGGTFGVMLGLFGIRGLLAVNTAGLPRLGANGVNVGLDWRLLAFAAAISVGTGIVFGVMPALSASRLALSSAMRDGAAAPGGGSKGGVRGGLVVLEIALALVLVIGSGLLIRTSIALGSVEPGFDANNVLIMNMTLADPQFQTSAGISAVIERGTARLRAQPGVEAASASCCLPLEGGQQLPFVVQGRPLTDGNFHGFAGWSMVSSSYFETFRIGVIQGRTFDDRDRAGSTPVVIINESMAKELWQDSNPVGNTMAIGRGALGELADEPDRLIVGVVAERGDGRLNQDPAPKVFVPVAQVPDPFMERAVRATPIKWLVRTRGEPLAMSAALQEALRQETGVPVANMRAMSEVVSRSTSRERFNMLLMSAFALSALALATIGIYGVMTYSVQQRTREIGVRLALGARPGAVQRMVVRQGMTLAVAGVGLGIPAAYGLSRFMASLLFGVTVRDPLIFAGVPVLLVLTALLAVWIPAARASRIDPLTAIRSS